MQCINIIQVLVFSSPKLISFSYSRKEEREKRNFSFLFFHGRRIISYLGLILLYLFVLQVFEVPSMGSGTFTNRVTLEPPHYDGVQTLALRDNILFSGSRDYVIKKWDLDSREILNVSIASNTSCRFIIFNVH